MTLREREINLNAGSQLDLTVDKEKEKYYPNIMVIGRFQPPCYHHFDMFKEIIESSGAKKLLLGIGSAVKPDEKNFLSFKERKEMIEPVLKELGIEYEIREIVDINNPPKYCEHVESIFPEMNESNTKIFTENDYTKGCFVNYGHNYIVESPTVLPSKATNVRQLMIDGGNWEDYVWSHVAKYIEEHNLIDKLKQERQKNDK